MITCDDVIEETKPVTINFNEKKVKCETKSSIFYFDYNYIIDREKQKPLLPFHITNNKLKEFYIDNLN